MSNLGGWEAFIVEWRSYAMASVKERADYYLVDSRGEGGLVSELDRVAMVDEPTLIIGLGGTGADALLNTKYVLHRKLKYPSGQHKPDRLAYLAIDTDARDLQTKRVGDTRLNADETCDITEMNLKAYMNDHSLITKSYLRDWLSNGIPPLSVAYGAGGIRQYGRFMLLNNAEAVSTRIKTAVEKIWAAGKENGEAFDPSNDSVNVYILTGISGGTGSGTFLDMAYMVREIITHKMSMELHLRLRGVVFMPDVNLSKVRNDDVRKYLPVNGYAAMKELDFWMNPERGRRFQQQYTDGLIVDTNEMPFDMCFMVSPNLNDRDPYTTCMQTTGEALLNILSGTEQPKAEGAQADSGANGNSQGFESFINNLVSMLPMLTKPYAGNYIFSTMGMDERRLQLDQMATYIAYYLLDQVQHLFDHAPRKEQVAEFYKTLQLDEHSMQRLFNQQLNVKPYPNVKDLDSFKEAIREYDHTQVLNQNLLEQELDMWAKQCDIFYDRKREQMIEERVEAVATQIEKLFADQEIGPFYAHRMLHNPEVGAPDVLKSIQTSIDRLEAFLLTAQNLSEQKKQNAHNAKEAARKSRFVPLMAGAKYNDFVEALFEQYDHERYIAFAQTLRRVYKELLAKITEYNNRIVGRFVDLLNALTEVFRANSNIITSVKRDGNNHNWNVFNFSEIQPSIDKAIEEMRHEGKNAMLVHEFLQMLLNERAAWLDDNGDLGESFSRFVSEKFSQIMDLSLEEHYKTMLGLNTDTELREHIERQVMPQLRSGSRVMFQANDRLCPVSNTAERSMICYPRVAFNIGQAVTNFVNTSSDMNGKVLSSVCDIVPNNRRGSIFWFRATFGMPLYTVSSIANYQSAYDNAGRIDHHLGRHLRMGADENWLDLLPPLMPDSIWAYQGYNNPNLAAKNDETRQLFQRAWDAQIVLPMPQANGKYVIGRADASALDALLATAPLSPEQQKLIAEQGAAAAASIRVDQNRVNAFLTAARTFLDTGWQVSDDMLKSDAFLTLRGGELVDTNTGEKRTRQILSENLTLTPDNAEKLRQQLALHSRLTEAITAHEDYVQLGDLEKSQRAFFAKSLFYGLYRKLPPKLYQLDGAAEGVAPFMLMTLNDYALAPAGEKYYAMFRKFNLLTDEQKGVMQQLIDLRTRKMDAEIIAGNLDRYSACIANIQVIDAELEARIQELTMSIGEEHPEILEFYQALRREFALWLSE